MGIKIGDPAGSCFNCKHYSSLWLEDCIKGKRKGEVLTTNICPLYERAKKEEESEKQSAKENKKSLQSETLDQLSEIERLRKEYEYLLAQARGASVGARSNNDEGKASVSASPLREKHLLYPIDWNAETLEEIQVAYRNAPEAMRDAVNDIIRTIENLRQMDLENDVFDNSDVKKSVRSVVETHCSFESAKVGLFEADFKAEFAQLKERADRELDRLGAAFVEEIHWHDGEGHIDIAFALADSFEPFKTEESKNLLQKCKQEYSKWALDKAKQLIQKKQYDEAIEILEADNTKEASSLLKTARREKDESDLFQAKRLAARNDYDGAIRLLEELGTGEALDLAEKYRIDKAIALYQFGRIFEALDELHAIGTSRAEDLARKMRSNSRRGKTAKISLPFLFLGAALLFAAVMINLLTRNYVVAIFLYVVSGLSLLAGIILLAIGLGKYDIERSAS